MHTDVKTGKTFKFWYWQSILHSTIHHVQRVQRVPNNDKQTVPKAFSVLGERVVLRYANRKERC